MKKFFTILFVPTFLFLFFYSSSYAYSKNTYSASCKSCEKTFSSQNHFNISVGTSIHLIPRNSFSTNTWKTSKSNLATISNTGLLTALHPGKLIVSCSNSNTTQYYYVNIHYNGTIPKYNDYIFSDLRKKWVKNIIGDNSSNSCKEVNRLVLNTYENANKYWTTLNKLSNNNFLWKDMQDYSGNTKLSDKQLATNIVSNYSRILEMCKAFVMTGSPLKDNKLLLSDIIYCLDWMQIHKYNTWSYVEYGKWWSWEIGAPKLLNDICMLMYDYIPYNKIDSYLDAIYFYQPDPFYSGYSNLYKDPYRETKGANRIDTSLVSIGLGILTKNPEEILMGKKAIESELRYVNNDNGFYKDGSFLQHHTVPYNGTYGIVFLKGVLNANYILNNSPFALDKNKTKILIDFVQDSFIPIVYRGAALDMVRGRAISRYFYNDRVSGHEIIDCLIFLANSTNEPYSTKFNSIAKQLILSDTYYNHIEHCQNINLILLSRSLLNNKKIKPLKETCFHKIFYTMDRIIHKGNDYLFALSMFSPRTTNYEYMNGENKKGWHTCEGMTYLYNNDLEYYSDNYWCTINPNRIPGTTVSSTPMVACQSSTITSCKDWVGGCKLGNVGVSGMSFQGVAPNASANNPSKKNYLSLNGKKSWFIFDNEIVCMGSDINSNDNSNIETVISNRKLKDDNSNIFTTNLGVTPSSTGTSLNLSNIKWAHLSGNVLNSDIGFFFPNNTGININRRINNGNWLNVGNSSPLDNCNNPIKISKNYLEVYINHGKNPSKANYCYVLLPNMNISSVKEYSNNPDISVLKNTPNIHAVKENKLNILAANFFEDGYQSLENFSVDKKCSILIKKQNNKTIEISISNPTMNNNSIKLTINTPISKVLHLDNGISFDQSSNKCTFKINTSNSNGKTFNIKLKLQ